MTETLDALLPKITRFLLLLGSDQPGEVVNAARALTKTLATQGLDLHALAERLESGPAPLSDEEMQRLYAAGYEAGHAEGIERGRKSAILAAAQPIGVFSGPVENGVNGYSWQQVATACASQPHLFSGRNLEFIQDMPEKISRYGKPTAAQAKWLGDLFMQKLGGRI